MKNFVTIEVFKALSKVTFYTFRVEGQPESTTGAFFSKFEEVPEVAGDLEVLVDWLLELGNKRGAKRRYFRPENDADALPPPARFLAELGNDVCRLRLYCFWLSEEVVILAGGGLKTGPTVQESPEVLPHFRFANRMAQQLLELLQAGELTVRGNEITNLEDLELWD